jgi:membrane protein implicated in regulation of membrane protease activity
MALIGVILLLIGAGAAVVTYIGAQAAGGTIALSALGFSRTVSPLELAIYAGVAVLLIALGWALLSAAARRRVRARREQKESARIAEVEEKAETARLDHERRFEEAGLRDEDLRRREDELTTRHETLDSRESELARREAEWRERQGPSVADVVTGRAEGNVHQGTASWTDEKGADSVDSIDNGDRAHDVHDVHDVPGAHAVEEGDGATAEHRTRA